MLMYLYIISAVLKNIGGKKKRQIANWTENRDPKTVIWTEPWIL